MKSDIFEVAMQSVKELTVRINGNDENYQKTASWCKVVPDSNKSPMVKQICHNKHLIYFPENSAEYSHVAENFSKICEIEFGTIVEKISGKTYKEGDTFTIPANTEICPVSSGGDAFAVVTLVG